MSESLITGVRKILRAAAALHGAGDPAAGPPSPLAVSPFRLSPMSGGGVALDQANAANAALGNRLEGLDLADAAVGRLMKAVNIARDGSLAAVVEESDQFEAAVAALRPIANTRLGTAMLFPPAVAAVAGAGGQVASLIPVMGDMSKQVPAAALPEDAERREVARVRRVSRSMPLSSLLSRSMPLGSGQSNSALSEWDRQRFRDELEKYRYAGAPGVGGSVPGMALARLLHGTRYAWGGFSPSGLDCSGFVSAVVNDALGLDPFAGRTSTHTMAEWLRARGALPGFGGEGDITVAWTNDGVGHTAMTFWDPETGPVNAESSGGYGVQFGGGARGADDPMFDQVAHIPAELLVGGAATVAV